MAEAKKTSTKKAPTPVAADKRKAADDALEARIAARKAGKPVSMAEPTKETTHELPFEPSVPAVAAPVVAAAVKPEKAKRVAVRKPKAEVGQTKAADVSDLVAKIEAKVSARIEKVHAQQLKALVKDHEATVKQLKAEHKDHIKRLGVSFREGLKASAEAEGKKAYDAGVKAGEKAATKSITAALKGR